MKVEVVITEFGYRAASELTAVLDADGFQSTRVADGRRLTSAWTADVVLSDWPAGYDLTTAPDGLGRPAAVPLILV